MTSYKQLALSVVPQLRHCATGVTKEPSREVSVRLASQARMLQGSGLFFRSDGATFIVPQIAILQQTVRVNPIRFLVIILSELMTGLVILLILVLRYQVVRNIQ